MFDNVALGCWYCGITPTAKATIFNNVRNAKINSSITSHKEHDRSRLQGESEYLSQDQIGAVSRNIVVMANQQMKHI
jgi:hypothetical protein